MRSNWSLRIVPFILTNLYREGEEGGEEGGGEDNDGGGAGGGEKTFTKAEVEKMMQDRTAKTRKENETLVAQLEQIKTSASLTAEEKEGLQTKINELESTFLTEKEKAAREGKAASEKYKKELAKSNKETELWKGRFTTAAVQRSLSDAAVAAGAESPEQIQMMFGSAVVLAEDKDDEGKTLGTFTPKMEVTVPKKDADDGETETLMLPVGDAIGRIKEAGLHKNLFKHGGTGGTGSKGTGQGSGTENSTKMPERRDGESQMDFSNRYNAWRKTHKLDGSLKEEK